MQVHYFSREHETNQTKKKFWNTCKHHKSFKTNTLWLQALAIFKKNKGRREENTRKRKYRSDYSLPNSHIFLFVLRRVFKLKLNFQAMAFNCKQPVILQDNWMIRSWAVEERMSGGTSGGSITDPSNTTVCKGHIEPPLLFSPPLNSSRYIIPLFLWALCYLFGS